MTDDLNAPAGLGRRRPRLSQDETERRMFQVAIDMVNSTGLTVSLDHISLEEVIREAGVSRSAAYRRWPYKDLFFSDLLKELARAATPAAVAQGPSLRMVRGAVLERLDWLETPRGRHELSVELIRQGAAHDFQIMYESREWRTYLALHATFLSLADGRLRDEVQAALAEAERGFTGRVAKSWEHMTTLLGYRLRPELATDFETLARLMTAASRGMVLMALSTPGLATRRVRADPFGTAVEEWSITAMGSAGIAFTFLEPDPEVGWNEERIAAVREALKSDDWSVI